MIILLNILLSLNKDPLPPPKKTQQKTKQGIVTYLVDNTVVTWYCSVKLITRIFFKIKVFFCCLKVVTRQPSVMVGCASIQTGGAMELCSVLTERMNSAVMEPRPKYTQEVCLYITRLAGGFTWLTTVPVQLSCQFVGFHYIHKC